MSLAIDPESVASVLLADDWHAVVPGTFDVDSYEYVDPDDGYPLGAEGIGFRFRESDEGDWVAGPLRAILAITHVRQPGVGERA